MHESWKLKNRNALEPQRSRAFIKLIKLHYRNDVIFFPVVKMSYKL